MVLAPSMNSVLDSMRSFLGALGAGMLVIYMIDNPGVLFTLVAGLLLAGLVFAIRKGDGE